MTVLLSSLPDHAEPDVADLQIRTVIVISRRHAQIRSEIIPAAAAKNRQPLGPAAIDQQPSLRVITLRRPIASTSAAASAPTSKTAAANATLRPLGIHTYLRQRSIVVVSSSIFHPLPHIAQHVVKPPRVRLLQADRVRLIIGIIRKPRVVLERRKRRPRSPCPSAILPLGLRREPIFVPIVPRVQLVEEAVNIILVHTIHGISQAL